MSVNGINFKTPVKVWSGRPADYLNIKVFGALKFMHIKQDEIAAPKCYFNMIT